MNLGSNPSADDKFFFLFFSAFFLFLFMAINISAFDGFTGDTNTLKEPGLFAWCDACFFESDWSETFPSPW